MSTLGAGVKRSFAFMEGDAGVSPMNALRPILASPTSSGPSSTFSTPAQFGALLRTGDVGIRSQSTSPAPLSTLPHRPIPRSFSPEASIVLIGIRGTGKSTLGVIASTHMHRRLIDIDWIFQEITGHTSTTYKKLNGAANHNRRQLEVLEKVLAENQTGCIIVVGSCAMEKRGQKLLRDYCKTNPVIHIVRDARSMQEYLKHLDADKVEHLLRLSGSIFRGCSNFEFFNLSEATSSAFPSGSEVTQSGRSTPDQRSSAPFLTLKKAERHFLKFITLVTTGNISQLESAYPLSRVSLDERLFTYAVSVPLSEIMSTQIDIEGLEVGSDAVEICIDHTVKEYPPNEVFARPEFCLDSRQADNISNALATVRRNTVTPVIYHVDLASLKQDPWIADVKQAYLDLVCHGLRLSPEFLTLDLTLDEADISSIVQLRGSTKIIGHLCTTDDNAPSWDDDYWLAAYESATRLGCDIIRLIRPANNHEDNASVEVFRSRIASSQQTRIPVIAYNTGKIGRTSICFNPILSAVTHRELQPSLSLRRPSITAQQATQALYAAFVFDPMRLYILGGSAGYSLSPAMHNAAYRACGMPHTYKTHQTPTLKDLHGLVEDPHFGGAALSIPFKLEVIALTHSLSRHARAIGAVNTLIPVRSLRSDGSIPDDVSLLRERNHAGPVKALYGENTDWIGIRACIRRGLSPVNAVRPRTSGLVIGAGGMARAAVYAMLHMGVKNIVIFNRTLENAEKVVAHFSRLLSGAHSPSGTPPGLPGAVADTTFHILRSRDEIWPESVRQPTMIVGCIPTHSLGSSPSPNFTLPPQWLKSPTGGVVLEVGYKSLRTPLLTQIRALASKGWVAMDGLDLLPEQGFAQFELFTGRRAPRRLMRMEVLKVWRDEEGRVDEGVIKGRLEHIGEEIP